MLSNREIFWKNFNPCGQSQYLNGKDGRLAIGTCRVNTVLCVASYGESERKIQQNLRKGVE